MSTAIAERQPDATATRSRNVYECIVAVAGEIAQEGIAKSRKNEQQGYRFRGIDEVMNALSPLLAKHRLLILPRVLSREVTERTTQKGSVLFYVVVDVEFDFVSASDGSKHTVKTYGEAMDSADKATNKAMSAAYKYAAFQTFCIPTEGDNDADAHTHDLQPHVTRTATPRAANQSHPDAGPDLGVDLPPGAHRVLNVGQGRVGAEAEITFDAKLEGGKDTYLTWSKDAAFKANEFARTGKPCFVELKRSTSGNYRVERLMAVPEDYMDAPA